MIEVVIKENQVQRNIFINGLPNLKLMPKTQLDILLDELEEDYRKFWEKKKIKSK